MRFLLNFYTTLISLSSGINFMIFSVSNIFLPIVIGISSEPSFDFVLTCSAFADSIYQFFGFIQRNECLFRDGP